MGLCLELRKQHSWETIMWTINFQPRTAIMGPWGWIIFPFFRQIAGKARQSTTGAKRVLQAVASTSRKWCVPSQHLQWSASDASGLCCYNKSDNSDIPGKQNMIEELKSPRSHKAYIYSSLSLPVQCTTVLQILSVNHSPVMTLAQKR